MVMANHKRNRPILRATSSGAPRYYCYRSQRHNHADRRERVRPGFGPKGIREHPERQENEHPEAGEPSGQKRNWVPVGFGAATGSRGSGWSWLTPNLAVSRRSKNGVLCYSCLAESFWRRRRGFHDAQNSRHHPGEFTGRRALFANQRSRSRSRQSAAF